MMHTLLAKSTVSFSPGGLSHARARKVSTYKTHAKKSIRMSGHADMDGHHKHLCMLLPSNGNIKHRHPNTDTQTQISSTDTEQTHKQNPPNTDRYPSKDSEYMHPGKTSKRTDAKHPHRILHGLNGLCQAKHQAQHPSTQMRNTCHPTGIAHIT